MDKKSYFYESVGGFDTQWALEAVYLKQRKQEVFPFMLHGIRTAKDPFWSSHTGHDAEQSIWDFSGSSEGCKQF